MTKIITILCFGVFVLQAQDITNQLGGTSESETYDITDSNDNVLFRVEGNGEIGIGTNTPDANLDVHGTVHLFKGFEYLSADVTYTANTDGLVIAYMRGVGELSGHADPPQIGGPTSWIIVESNTSSGTLSITMPVPKGYEWKVKTTGAITTEDVFWVPLGQ